MTDALLAPFAFDFFRNGLAVAALAGALCGLVGTYVVLRGMSYIGHGLSHAIFGGFAASALLGVNVLLGAGLWGLASALVINVISRRRSVGADAAIGVVTTASFAFGLTLFALFGRAGENFDAALFGSVLGVAAGDVWAVAAVLAVAVGFVAVAYRPLLFTAFDPEVARASGVPTAWVDAILMAVLSASILTTMRVIGVTLVAAAIVIPPSVARLMTDSFDRMLLLSTGLGAAFGAIGMVASYHLDVQSGPAIVLVGAAAFIAAYLATARRPPVDVGDTLPASPPQAS